MDDRGNAAPTEAFMSNKGKKKCFDVESRRVGAERQDNCGKVSRSAEVYQTAQPSKPIMSPFNLPAEMRSVDRQDQERGQSQRQELLQPLPRCAPEE